MIATDCERPARHAFLYVDPDRLARDWPMAPSAADRTFALEWFAHRYPAIAARGCMPDAIAAGIATPPTQGKRRIALQLPRGALVRIAPPPALRSVAEHAAAHQPALMELTQQAEAEGIHFRVFGSFAWQHLTGFPYVSATSDLDLLWQPVDECQLAAGIDVLARWERRAGLRADGEIEFARGEAVNWREWAQGHAEVLIKRLDSVHMMPRTHVRIVGATA